MIAKFRLVSWVSLWRKLVWASMFVYSCLATVLLFKLSPKPILIGIDSYGTRIITSADDRLIKQEKENFLKKFLVLQYNYDSENYKERASKAGDFMSKDLWTAKTPEFQKIAEGLQKETLTQKLKIEDIREIDPQTYQADLVLQIVNRLQEKAVKLRVDVKLKTNLRNEQNPYPYEVISYEEQIIS